MKSEQDTIEYSLFAVGNNLKRNNAWHIIKNIIKTW